MQDATAKNLLPAIALTAKRADDADIAVGDSKFGGAPDVPDGFGWPMWKPAIYGQSVSVQSRGEAAPLSFVAQLNLDELAPFDIEGQLPASGLLSFFYFMAHEDQWPWGETEQEGGWRVFHFESELSRAEVPDDAQIEHGIRTAVIEPRAFWSAPKHPYYVTGEQWNAFPQEAIEAWWTMIDRLAAGVGHQMFGYPEDIQDDARMEAANTLKRGTMDDWHLLFQVNTDDEIGFMWGDAGAMFYLMHRDDLKARDFGKCWLIAQCS